MNKLLVICGPTSVGKSSLAVQIAKKHGGEVISADSRQVYRGLDVATGKINQKDMGGIPHHLLDVSDPEDNFSVADFKGLADKRIEDIHQQDKLPILCGGTGFYIQAVVNNLILPDVPPNEELRDRLSTRDTESLFKELKQKDPRRAEEIDENNPRRLIRALEIVDAIGHVPELKKEERFNTLQIGLDMSDKELKQRIIKRTKQRFEDGIIDEAKQLQEDGLTLARMKELGLEYEHLADYLTGNISKEELFKNIVQSDWQYARRQRTWFRKDDRIKWFDPLQDKSKILKKVTQFIKSNSE